MTFEIRWLPMARTRMRKISAYLERNRPEATDRVLDLIDAAVARLADFPYSGDFHHKSNGDEIREIIAASYRIFFLVKNDEMRIEVLKVWHSSRDEPSFNEDDE